MTEEVYVALQIKADAIRGQIEHLTGEVARCTEAGDLTEAALIQARIGALEWALAIVEVE